MKKIISFILLISLCATFSAVKPLSSHDVKIICAALATAGSIGLWYHLYKKGKNIIVPITVLECPGMRIFSVRFYKNGIVVKEIVNKNLEKELKRKLKIPKKDSEKIENIKPEDYEDIRIIVYSNVKKTDLKKTPDLTEIGLFGNKEEKLNFVKENLNKEISR